MDTIMFKRRVNLQFVLLSILMTSTISNGFPQNRRKSGQSARKMERKQQLLVLPGDIVINQSQTNEEIIEFPTWDIPRGKTKWKESKKSRTSKSKTTDAVFKFPGEEENNQSDTQSDTEESSFSTDGMWDDSTNSESFEPHRMETDRNAKVTDLNLKNEYNDEDENPEESSDDNLDENVDDTIDTDDSSMLTSSSEILTPTTLEECIKSDQQFCEDSSVKFSNKLIESILEKPENKMFMKFFRDPDEDDDAFIQNRFGARPQGVRIELCETKRTLTYPTYARDFNGDYSAIINTRNYRQPVKIEMCASSEPNPIWQPKNYKLVCSQGYQTYQLLSPAEQNMETFNLKTFDVPSHCKIDLISFN